MCDAWTCIRGFVYKMNGLCTMCAVVEDCVVKGISTIDSLSLFESFFLQIKLFKNKEFIAQNKNLSRTSLFESLVLNNLQ